MRGGTLVLQRSPEERAANPDRINLDRRQLTVRTHESCGLSGTAMSVWQLHVELCLCGSCMFSKAAMPVWQLRAERGCYASAYS